MVASASRRRGSLPGSVRNEALHFRALVVAKGFTFESLSTAAAYPLRTLYLLASGHVPKDKGRIQRVAKALDFTAEALVESILAGGRLHAKRHGV